MSSQDPIPPYSEWLKTRKPPTSDIPTFDQFKASRTTRPRNRAQAEADVAKAGEQFQQARDAYMSASGQKLNPPVDPSTAGSYRSLTADERAAQQRGEPIIISEAQQAPVAPESTTRPRTVNPAPVTLDPVIQGRMEQIEREKRHRETQQKVEQARQVMQRRQRPDIVTAMQRVADQANQITGNVVREPVSTIPRAADYLAPAERQPTFAEDRERRRKLSGIGELRKHDDPLAAREIRLQKQAREQVTKDVAGSKENFAKVKADYERLGRGAEFQQKVEQATTAKLADFRAREAQVKLAEEGKLAPLGLMDKISEVGSQPSQLVPFLASAVNVFELLKLGDAARRLEEGKATEDDVLRLREFNAASLRDSTFMYKVANVVSGLPSFVGELALTGGLYTAGKEAALKGLERLASKQGLAAIEKRLAGRMAVKSVASLAGSALQTLPASATRIPEGVLYRRRGGAEFGEALRDTLTDQFIEIASERAGGLLGEIPLPKRLAAIRDAVTARWVNKVHGRTAEQLQKLVERTGWHGPVGEILEERVGDAAKYSTGLQSSPVPTLQQLAVEGLAFSVPGVIEAGASRALQRRAPIPDSERNIYYDVKTDGGQVIASGVHVNDLVAYMRQVPNGGALRMKPLRSTGPNVEYRWIKPSETSAAQSLIDYAINSPLTSAADKAKIEKLAESGASTEDVQAILSPQSEQVSIQVQKPETRAEKSSVSEPVVEKPQQIAPDQIAEERAAKTLNIIPELIQPVSPETVQSPAVEPTVKSAVKPPAEVNTRPSATESQLETAKEVSAVADQSEAAGLITQAPGQETVPDKPIADISPRIEEPKSGNAPTTSEERTAEAASNPANAAQRLQDWGTRLKAIAQSRNLDDLQALSDEMAGDKADPRVARLRTSIQEQIARARQRSIYTEQPNPPEVETPGKTGVVESGLYTNKSSKAAQKTLKQAESPEGKTVRSVPTHRIGVPKADASRNPLEQQVRAHGGVKDDADLAYKGELKWLSESARRGTVNQTGGISVEQMATKLAQDGYGKGVWWEGAANNVDPQRFLQAVMDDARGSTRHYSSERDEIEDDPDVKAWDSLIEGEAGKELVERVQSGHARAADIVQFVREAGAHGLSDNAIDAFVASLQRTVQEELSTGTQEGQGYTLDEDGTLLDPDGNPLFAREFQLGLPSEGLTQQTEQPKTDDQRERLRREQQERDEAADPERAKATRKLEEIHRRGMSVDEYARQGSMFEAAPSGEEIKLLRELEQGQPKPESGQSSMFAKGEGESGPAFGVEANRVSLGPEGAKLLNEAFRESGRLAKDDRGDVRGAFEKAPETLVATLDKMAKAGRAGAVELADAVHRAAREGSGKVVLFAGEGARKHELFHEASDKANRLLDARHSDLASLTENDTFSKMYRALTGLGYPRYNMAVLIEEAAAHIAEGRYDQLGITREEAVEWMYKWFQSFEAKNPHVNPRQFQELADEAEEARKGVYESVSRQSQSYETVSSLQAGREGGDRASLARSPDVTQTEAFKRWFGDSKVVDKKGEPLVVYHGTRSSLDFDAFDTPAHFGTPVQANEIVTGVKIYSTTRSVGPRVVPAYLSIKNPKRVPDVGGANNEWEAEVEQAEAEGYDGLVYRNDAEGRKRSDSWVAFYPSQIKSATGNRGTFDPNDPNILMARSDDPWADLIELSDEFGRLANEPELAPGEKPRSLPKTLEAAGLESGTEKGYFPESLADAVPEGQKVISDKGIDGAMEFVRTGDGIEWASTGYEVSGRLRAEEASLRAEGKTAEADETRDKRLKFLDDFAMGAVERGRSIVGIKAIAEYAPDRMAYMLNKASLKKRKRGISPEEESRVTKLGEELGALADRNKALQKALDKATESAQARPHKGVQKPKKTDYQSALDQQASTVLQTLKPKVGKFDFGYLEKQAKERFPAGAAQVGIPPLPGDAELIAQYAAAQLSKHNTVADLNAHLLSEFGQELAPYLSKIRQRAYAIRQDARLAEIEAEDTEPPRRKTILSEIQKEIGDALRTIREAQKAQDLAVKAQRAAEAKSERAEARLEAQQARSREHETRKQEIKEARAELKRLRQEMKEASKAETKGYRETIKAQRGAARKAELWDTPLRNEALAASERLKDAPDIKDPQAMDDLVSVAAAKFLPEKEGGTPRTGAAEPGKIYRDLKDEFPNLVTKKNQAEIYKRGYQRIQDATAAAREAARMRSASAESKRLWDELGVDVDAQAVLIQQAEVRRQTDELRRKAVAEFNRVNKTMLEKVWMEVQSIPRALQSSIDAPLGRQGVYFLLTHPIQASKAAIPATLQGYGSIHVVDYARHETDLKQHPDYELAVKSGLDLSATSSGGDPALVAEEQFQSPLASRIFPHVRLSEQGFVLGMNAERLAMFSRLADTGRGDGYTAETHPEFFAEVARFVNDGTGRGNLPDAIKRASALTNFFFFSTRLNLSRIQLLNDLFNPVKYIPEQYNAMRAIPGFGSYDPAMRKVMAKELIRLGAALSTVYLLASAMGIKIDLDPDDPDALLLRIRNTRYDITGGEVGTLRFLYRFLSSIYKTANGEDLAPFEQPLAIAARFTRYKLAPLPGGVIDALTGKDAVGQPANLRKFESTKQVLQQNIIIKRLLPMMTGNLIDAVSEEGWIGVPMTLPALAGFGMSSYPDRGIRAIKNQAVVDTLEELKITSQSLLGQKTKDDELDKAIEGRIMAKVETLDIPTGATDIGKEKIIRERLAQIRLLAKAETALADPARYKHYLADREAGESLSFLTDEEKKTLTEDDLKAYRQSYAENYLKTLQRVASTDNYQKADDDKKEKILARVGQAAHTLAKVGMVKTKRRGETR